MTWKSYICGLGKNLNFLKVKSNQNYKYIKILKRVLQNTQNSIFIVNSSFRRVSHSTIINVVIKDCIQRLKICSMKTYFKLLFCFAVSRIKLLFSAMTSPL